jgi:hypothetical protein
MYNWSQIEAGVFRFKHYEEQVALLRKAKRADLLALLDEHLLSTGTHRAMLSTQIVSQRLQPGWLVPTSTHTGLNALLETKPTIAALEARIDELKDLDTNDRCRALAMHCWPAVPEGVELIADPVAFRRSLEEAPQPVAAKQYAALFPQL